VEEGVAGMRAGGTRRLTIPAALAFPGGARFPGGEIPPDSALTYTVKLLRVSVPPS
jgi:FKBP-type peptidyl-prolyl cis-trans isomerase FkpA